MEETLEILQITEQYQEQDVLELQNQMEDEFTSIGRTPISLPRNLIKGTTSSELRNPNPETTITKSPTPFSIKTSPMKRLRLTSNEDNVQIPLIESIQKNVEYITPTFLKYVSSMARNTKYRPSSPLLLKSQIKPFSANPPNQIIHRDVKT